jgi:F-type H+-transporting ATPase subunit epsilon
VEGRLGILPNHTPLLTALDFGEVMVRTGQTEQFFAIGGGFAEVGPEQVIVLADSAEQAEEIDLERAERARESARRAMQEGVPEDSARFAQIEAALKKAQIRIDVGRRRSSGARRRPRGVAELSRDENED